MAKRPEPRKQDIETRLLDVDISNFRIGDFDNVRDAYHAMIEQEEDDLANLAEDIIENGLSLGDLFFVCPDPDNDKHFIVVDGNRRFTALKLLEKPILAEGTRVHRRFIELSKRYLKKPIRKVSTVVYPDKEAAMPWIRRRHQDLGGKGMSQWKGKATGRADAFGGRVRPSAAVIAVVKQSGQLPVTLERVLDKRTTNLDRVLQMPYMKAALGVIIEKNGEVSFANGDRAAGVSLLAKMLRAMGAPKFSVNDIRNIRQRQDFIDSFDKYNVLAEEEVDEPQSGRRKKAITKAAKKAAKKAPLQEERRNLALRGRDYVLTITDERLSELYDEALRIQPEGLANSSSLLTRVFLELSTDHFLTANKIPIPQSHISRGRTLWRDKGISLEEKIAAVLARIDPTGKDPDFKEVRRFKDRGAIHSVDALHDFMHNLKSKPDPREVKRIWQRWHQYFERLFASI